MSTASVKFNPEKYKQAIYVIDKVMQNPYVIANAKYMENRKLVKELYRLKLMVALESENNETSRKELIEKRKNSFKLPILLWLPIIKFLRLRNFYQ